MYPIFDSTGSKFYPSRWNSEESPLIYTSEHYATAMLEILAYVGNNLPPNQHFVEITIPNGLSYEILSTAHLSGWDDPSRSASRDYGDAWCKSQRSVVLLVPSVVARMERNILINPAHPEFNRITAGLHQPIWWDKWLFGSG